MYFYKSLQQSLYKEDKIVDPRILNPNREMLLCNIITEVYIQAPMEENSNVNLD